MATPAMARTARPPTTLPAITPVLLLLEEEESFAGAEVAEGAADGVFEGDALVCEDCEGVEDAAEVTLDDDIAAVVVAAPR
jgi:hypothetical protein